MELLLRNLEDSSVNVPKLSSSTFEMKNNYYVVTNGATFNYYPIKTLPSEESNPLIRLERCPPVILEGVAVIGKKVYHVTVEDLLRRVIRKSREVQRETQNGTDSKTSGTNTAQESTTANAGSSATKTVQHSNKQSASREVEVEIGQAADLAWNEQIGSLLAFISEKEGEWEVTEAP